MYTLDTSRVAFMTSCFKTSNFVLKIYTPVENLTLIFHRVKPCRLFYLSKVKHGKKLNLVNQPDIKALYRSSNQCCHCNLWSVAAWLWWTLRCFLISIHRPTAMRWLFTWLRQNHRDIPYQMTSFGSRPTDWKSLEGLVGCS